MWTSRDGKNLKLLRSDLRRISRRMRGGKGQSKARAPTGQPDFSLVGPVGRLARRARQVGVLRRPECDCSYPVFASKLGRQSFHIIVRTLPSGDNAIVSIRIIVAGR